MITSTHFGGASNAATAAKHDPESAKRVPPELKAIQQREALDTFVREIRVNSNDARSTIDKHLFQHYLRKLFKEGTAPKIGPRTETQHIVPLLLKKTDLSLPVFLANKQYVIHEAIRHDQPGLLREALKAGNLAATINQSDGLGFSPLSTAILKHNKNAVRLLMAHGADPFKPDDTGTTPLEWTAYSGNRRLFNELIEQLPPADRTKAHQDLDDLVTAQANQAHQILSSPLDHRQELFNQTIERLQEAERAEQPDEYKQAIGELSHIVRKGVDVDAVVTQGRTQLINAAKKSSLLTMKTLLLYGADIDKGNSFGCYVAAGGDEYQQNPLHYAAKHGHTEAAKLLIDTGADIDRKDEEFGGSPLHFAKTDEIAEALLKAGAHPNQEERHSQLTPLDQAAVRSNLSRLKLLIQYGARPRTLDNGATTLHITSKRGSKEIVEAIIDAGGNPNAPDGEGRPPLSWAIVNYHIPAAQALLEAGAIADATDPDEPDKTPLKQALQSGNFKLSKLLLEHGADLSKVEDEKGNALHHAAASSDDDQFADFLVERNVDRDQQNQSAGDTPLHVALKAKHPNFAEKLLQKGASQSITNNAGDTPLAVAINKMKKKRAASPVDFWQLSDSDSD